LGADSRAVRALPDGRVVLLNHAGLGVTLLDSDGNVLSEVMLGAAATIAYSVDVWPLDGSLLFAGQTLDRLNGKVYSTGTDAFAFKLRASSLLPSN
ncbi:MAG: hypothetical protein KC766_32825, partial [Myxococcales bacterium]|nr:hypothetical protein [Myxococcales bacterium]